MSDRKMSLVRALIAGPLGIPRRHGQPDSCEIAAWLEGRLPEEEAARVEAWLAHDPRWRQALMMLPGAHAQELSAAESARAQALVPDRASPSPIRGEAWWWPIWLRWAPALAFDAAMAVGGFFVGSELGAAPWRRDALTLAQILSGWPL